MIYDAAIHKPLVSDVPRFQQEYEESRGLLLRVHKAAGFAVTVFSWGAVALSEELKTQPLELEGKKIGILRLDGCYHVRELE